MEHRVTEVGKNNSTGNLVVFLEGLPGSRKTEIIKKLKEAGYSTIPEILNPEELETHHNKPNQTFFFLNDERKAKLAEKATRPVVVDRSPLSTLFFNLARYHLDQAINLPQLFEWYLNTFGRKFAREPKYLFLFIDIPPEVSIRHRGYAIDRRDPWRNPEALKLIRTLYLTCGKGLVKNFITIDGSHDFNKVLTRVKAAIKNA